MKAWKIIIVSIILIQFFNSCAKDRGNYVYENINELEIVDMNGDDLNGKSYSYSYGGEIRFKPQVSGTLSGEDLSRLAICWLKGRDTVSNTLELSIASEMLGVGTHSFVLHVLDRQTTITYAKQIYIYVIAGIVNGTYLLTATNQGESVLSVIGSKESDFFRHFRQFGEVTLGNKPIRVQIIPFPQWSVHITTSEGDCPIVALDLYTYLPILRYTKFGSVISGEPLQPTYMELFTYRDRLPGIVLMDGKCRYAAFGKVGPIINSEDPLNYDFGQKSVIVSKLSGLGNIFSANFVGGFDQRNERIRIFGNELYEGGVQVYDEVFNPDDTKGHSYVAAAELLNVKEWQAHWRFLTRKGQVFYLHNITFKANNRPEEAQVIVTKGIPEMEGAANFIVYDKYWYFSRGRAIYRCSANTLDVSLVLTLPNDNSGDIVAWNFDLVLSNVSKKIGIATFDENSAKPKKGSFYLYDIATASFEKQERNKIDKAVSIDIL